MSSVPFVLVGALGRMGRAIASLAAQGGRVRLVLPIERKDHASMGESYGRITGTPPYNDLVVSALSDSDLSGATGIIDFSHPDSSLLSAKAAAEAGLPWVSGSTGWTAEQLEHLHAYSSRIPMLLGSNMSVGVNLLFVLTEIAARSIRSKGFDAEIMEIHHRLKKDSPSGTSRSLEKILSENLTIAENKIIHGRSGMIGARPDEEIGSMALRGGDVVGDHTVFFLGSGERLELKHQAVSRETFASGAIEALLFLQNREPGMYTMRDVLGLS